MRLKILLLLAFALMVNQADAQNFLKAIGKAVGNKVKNEVKNEVRNQVVEKMRSAENDSNRQQPQESQEQRDSQESQEQRESPEQQDLRESQESQEPQSLPTQAPSINPHSQYTQDNPPKSPYSSISIRHRVLVADVGQNIVQQAGLDYIDEYGINHGGGILISGILWAPVNCGYHATKFPYGKLFQWGRKHGQGYGEPFQHPGANVNPDELLVEIVPGPATPAEARKYPNRFYAGSDYALFNWTRNDVMLWNKFTDDGYISKNVENDPCPKGWRLPEMQDFNILRLNYSETTEKDGQKGHWCSGTEPYSTNVQRIFLPYAGYRNPDGKANGREKEGAYWSGRHGGGEALVWHLCLCGEVKIDSRAYPHEAYAVRCVKDIEGQRLR